MKKFLLVCLSVVALSNCKVNKIDSAYHQLDENIDFKIVRIVNGRTRSASSQTTYISNKGFRYKQVHLKIRNNSEEKQEFDLSHLYLLDKYNRKHKVSLAVKSMQLQTGNSLYNIEKKLGGKKEGLYMLDFTPAFPKDELILKIAIDTSDSESLSENARIISLVTE